MRFTCSRCGLVHEGLADIVFDAPFYYYTVPESERATKCWLTADLCSIENEDFFIRGRLDIPILEAGGVFAWGVWVSVSRHNFELYQQVFRDPDQSRVGPFVGWLSNRLPGYPDTLKLKARAHLRDQQTRPSLELEPTDHPLAMEQRKGVTVQRIHQFYEAHLHAS